MKLKQLLASFLRSCAPVALPCGGTLIALLIIGIGRLFSGIRTVCTAVAGVVWITGLALPKLRPNLAQRCNDRLTEDADILTYLAGQDAYPLMMDDVPLDSYKEDTQNKES